jgi:hypothetical protein
MKKREEIEQELLEFAPNLSIITRKKQILPADAYFGSMQDAIMSKIYNQDDAPATEYFNSMQENVMAKIVEKKSSKIISLNTIVKWSVAASVALLMLWLPYNHYITNNQTTYASELNIDIDNQQEVDYLIDYLNTDADFNYLQSITSEESLPSEDIPTSDDYLLSDEDLELLIDM